MELGRRLNAHLLQLEKRAITANVKAPVEPIMAAHFRPVYLLIDTDISQNAVQPRELIAALAAREFALRVFVDGDEFSEAILERVPAAVICEAALMPALSELLDNIEREQPGISAKIALLAINRSASAARRLTAALGWADMYLEAPTASSIAEHVEELSAPRNDAPFNVLIVDDDRQQAMFCAGVLKRKGMEVISALSAEEALTQLATTRPDLVLMDLYLPGLNGMELTAILRERSDSLLLPIVFLSGEQDAQKRFDALNIGGDDYLTKPIRPRHLATAVASRIKRVRALRAQLAEARAPIDNHGLYRRNAFLEHLQAQAELANTGTSAQGLFYIAVDCADQMVGELGILEQNTLEQSLIERISENLDGAHALCALGNFEYALLGRKLTVEHLVKWVEKIRASVATRAFKLGADELALSLSIGFAEHSDARAGAERWLTLAQMASQRATRQGGNRVERGLSEPLQTLPARSQIVEQMLKDAPTRTNTLIEYQPLVPLCAQPVHQYVQHLRLRGNTVSTSQIVRQDYLAPAERSEAIHKLDRYACLQAISTLREGGRALGNTRLIVRCAVSTLLADLTPALKVELATSGIHAAQLCCEFDSSDIELDFATSQRRIEQLRALGVSIALNIGLQRPRTKSIVQKVRPDFINVHAALLESTSSDLLAMLDAHAPGAALSAYELSGPANLEKLWAQRIGFVLADFLGPARTHLDFNFTAGRAPASQAA
jgi:PleD family two-component response regulator/EAL domain-containing protein (putative c-di-GMP-specific phosphodiesterase class I)